MAGSTNSGSRLRSLFTPALTALALALTALALGLVTAPAAGAVEQQSVAEQVAAANAQGNVNSVPGLLSSSGCMVCHGDPKVTMKVGKKLVSIYVNPADIASTIHKNLTCTDCHVDFGFRIHTDTKGNWKKVAGMACAKCHTHRKQNEDYSSSYHATVSPLRPGRRAPNCADCHGAHNVGRLTKPGPYRTWFRTQAKMVCGGCHPRFYKAYGDYYHGQAYKQHAVDAPACWDCHDAHQIFPARDPRSSVGALKITKTCDRCHKGSSKDFTKYSELIHQKTKATKRTFLSGAFGFVGRTVTQVGNILVGWLGKAQDQSVGVLRIFFPQSLRPQK